MTNNNTPLIVGGALIGGLYLLNSQSSDPLFGGVGANLSGGAGSSDGITDNNTPYVFNIFQEPATSNTLTKKSSATTPLAETYFSTNNLTSSTNRSVNIFERTSADDPDRFAYSSIGGIADRFAQQSVTMETAQQRQTATKKSSSSSSGSGSINYTPAPTPTFSRPAPIFSVTPIRDSVKPPKLFSTMPVNSTSARTPTFNTSTTNATQSKKSSHSGSSKASVITQSPFSFVRGLFR